MKKHYALLLLAATFAGTASLNAQTILDEGFETSSTETYSQPVADGWTTVNSYTGQSSKFVWSNDYNEKGTITNMLPSVTVPRLTMRVKARERKCFSRQSSTSTTPIS